MNTAHKCLGVLLLLFGLSIAASGANAAADVVLFNGSVYTLNTTATRASALALAQDKIL